MRICICISGHLKKLFRIFILFFLSFFFPKIASSILNETGIRIFSLDASDQRAKMSLRYASYAYKHKSHDRSKNSRWLSFGTLTIIILVLAIFMYSLNDGTHVKKKKSVISIVHFQIFLPRIFNDAIFRFYFSSSS